MCSFSELWYQKEENFPAKEFLPSQVISKIHSSCFLGFTTNQRIQTGPGKLAAFLINTCLVFAKFDTVYWVLIHFSPDVWITRMPALCCMQGYYHKNSEISQRLSSTSTAAKGVFSLALLTSACSGEGRKKETHFYSQGQ